MEARIELMVGDTSTQHLKVSPVWHIDGIKFDSGSYSWHFYPYFYKATVWKGTSLAAPSPLAEV